RLQFKLILTKGCAYITSRGDRTESYRRTDAAPDPDARPRRRADGGRDRVALRRLAAGDLTAPERPEGGGARERATQRHEAAVPGAAGRPARSEGVSRGVLGRPPGRPQTRSREGGEEEAWTQQLRRRSTSAP